MNDYNLIKVSVIVPVYNSSKYLKQCLDSILNQSLREIEIICVDDGSTDDSLEILKDYSVIDNRIIILEQRNQGAGVARNNGLIVARGEYLSFLDSDDFFESTMLEIAYNEAKSKSADILIFGCDLYDNESHRFLSAPWVLRKELLPEKNPFNYKDINKKIFNIGNGWAFDKLFKMEFVKKNKNLIFQNLRTSNDMFFVFLAYVLADSIYHIDNLLLHQRINNSNSLSNTREKSWDCFYFALKKLKDELIKLKMFTQLEQSYVNWALNFSLWHYHTIKGENKKKIYNKLKNEWFKSLGIYKYRYCKHYFYKESEYNEFIKMIDNNSLFFELWRICYLTQEYYSRNGLVSTVKKIYRKIKYQ